MKKIFIALVLFGSINVADGQAMSQGEKDIFAAAAKKKAAAIANIKHDVQVMKAKKAAEAQAVEVAEKIAAAKATAARAKIAHDAQVMNTKKADDKKDHRQAIRQWEITNKTLGHDVAEKTSIKQDIEIMKAPKSQRQALRKQDRANNLTTVQTAYKTQVAQEKAAKAAAILKAAAHQKALTAATSESVPVFMDKYGKKVTVKGNFMDQCKNCTYIKGNILNCQCKTGKTKSPFYNRNEKIPEYKQRIIAPATQITLPDGTKHTPIIKADDNGLYDSNLHTISIFKNLQGNVYNTQLRPLTIASDYYKLLTHYQANGKINNMYMHLIARYMRAEFGGDPVFERIKSIAFSADLPDGTTYTPDYYNNNGLLKDRNGGYQEALAKQLYGDWSSKCTIASYSSKTNYLIARCPYEKARRTRDAFKDYGEYHHANSSEHYGPKFTAVKCDKGDALGVDEGNLINLSGHKPKPSLNRLKHKLNKRRDFDDKRELNTWMRYDSDKRREDWF